MEPSEAASNGRRLPKLESKTASISAQPVEHDIRYEDPNTIHLERISRSFIQAINVRHFSRASLPWTHMDRSIFRATFDQSPLQDLALDEYLAALKRITDTRPDHQVEIVHSTVSIDSDAKRADVFLSVKTHGLLDDGLVTEGIGNLKFLWSDGEWRCVRYMGLRGSLGANDVVGPA